MKTALVVLIALLVPGVLVMAQENNVIAYGEVIAGEITVQEFESTYSFEGNAGDIIRVVLTPKQATYGWSHWYHPEILLLDRDLQVIAEIHSYQSAALIYELPDTSEYHLIATGWNGRTQDNVGEFELMLELLPELVDGDLVDCEASSTIGKHYLVRTDRDFAVAYQHSEGRFRPAVSINVIAENPYDCGIDSTGCSSDSGGSNLHEVATLNGAWLDSGTLAVSANSRSGDLYIVEVAADEWSHLESELNASFTLELSISDD